MKSTFFILGLFLLAFAVKINLSSGYAWTLRTYLGCYQDEIDSNETVFSYKYYLANNSNLTQGYCATKCFSKNVSYIYSGVENGEDCYCDSVFQSSQKLGSSFCNESCPGMTNTTCGGNFTLEVSKLMDLNFSCPSYLYVNQTFNCSVNYIKISQGNTSFKLDFGNGNNSTVILTNYPQYFQNSYKTPGYKTVKIPPFSSNTILVYGWWNSWGPWETCWIKKRFYTDNSSTTLYDLIISGISCNYTASNETISSQISSIATQAASAIGNISQNTQAAIESLNTKYQTSNAVGSAWGAVTIVVVVMILVLTVVSDLLRLYAFVQETNKSRKISDQKDASKHKMDEMEDLEMGTSANDRNISPSSIPSENKDGDSAMRYDSQLDNPRTSSLDFTRQNVDTPTSLKSNGDYEIVTRSINSKEFAKSRNAKNLILIK